jgi:D-glycero-D-manno-heptose 1,7-bisphosphate phosphatase
VSRPAVFLDRDGVINRAIVRDGQPYPPASREELELMPGVEEALRRLKSAGYLLIVATNQPDVARGTLKRAEVEAIHDALAQALPIDAFQVCFHDDADQCACRKPLPGMLLDAAAQWDVDLARSYMVGDRWRDVAAAQAAGCEAIFFDQDYHERQPQPPFHRVRSLGEAVDIITRVRGAT